MAFAALSAPASVPFLLQFEMTIPLLHLIKILSFHYFSRSVDAIHLHLRLAPLHFMYCVILLVFKATHLRVPTVSVLHLLHPPTLRIVHVLMDKPYLLSIPTFGLLSSHVNRTGASRTILGPWSIAFRQCTYLWPCTSST